MKFYGGMNRDRAHIDQPQDTYRRARNIILDHTTLSVRTEGVSGLVASAEDTTGNDTLGSSAQFDERELCGTIDLPQDRQLFIFQNITDSTNDLYLIENNEYSIIYSSADFNWTPANPIKGVAYEDARGQVIAVWTDGVNKPVYTNIDATSIVIYDLFPTAIFPNARALPIADNTSGFIENGTYTFFIAYEIDLNNLTTFSPSYGAFKVGAGLSDKIVETQIGLEFENLDTNYSFYRIYVIQNKNETLNSYYVGRQPTTEAEFIWNGNYLTGNIATDQLTVPAGWYTSAETLSSVDDRLYLANLTRNDNFDGQSIANDIILNASIWSTNRHKYSENYFTPRSKNWGAQYNNFNIGTLDDPVIPAHKDHYGMSMGFMPGCSYAFYIAFLLQDGTWTQAYHIPAGTSEFDPTIVALDPITGWPELPLGQNTDPEKFHFQCGSKQTSVSPDTYVHVIPEPDLIADVWGNSDTYNEGKGTDYHDSNMWAPTNIGVVATNVNIPEDVKDLIQGYSLFYAKPTANTRDVLGYIPMLYQFPHAGNVVLDLDDLEFSCYDIYLNANKPSLQTASLKVVYGKNNTNIPSEYYNPVAEAGGGLELDIDEFEYLPGNSTGLVFNNDNRANKLILPKNTDISWNKFRASIGVTNEVRGTGSEGSLLKFGTGQTQYDTGYYTEVSDMSFAQLSQVPSNWYRDIDNLVLCACSFIEQDLDITSMSRVSWGGDAVVHPVRFREIRYRNAGSSLDNEFLTVGQEYHNTTDLKDLYVKPHGYWTWSYALQGYEDLTDPTMFTTATEQNYNNTYSGGASYGGAPEIININKIPGHAYRKNDYKSAFTSSLTDPVFNFPNRIIRSAKQNYDSNSIKWKQFAIADYYDNAFKKGPIQNIESYSGELLIHHTDGIFKTIGKETLETSASAVFVGSGDIFRSPPLEVLPTEEGYAGLAKHTDACLTKAGYIFVDAQSGKVFKLHSDLADLSQKGMRNYFREDFRIDLTATHSPYLGNGYSIGFDPIYDRILITCLTTTAEDVLEYKTISYSVLSDCWASTHEYSALAYATNRTGTLIYQGVTKQLRLLNQGNNTQGAYIELVFNPGGSAPKVFQSFQWVTRLAEGEGDWADETFDSAIVYNDRGCSGVRDLDNNIRWVEEAWNFNDFRDLIAEADRGNPFFNDLDELIATITTTKPWYQQQRIRGGYVGIRLIISPNRDITLYLSEALVKARSSFR
jgi:hypothetical protein